MLKNAGLALAQISGHLAQTDEAALAKIQENLMWRAQELQRRLAWVDAEIRSARNSTDCAVPRVVIKRIGKTRVCSERARIDSYDQADAMLHDLARGVPKPARLVSGAIWHDCGARSKTIDCEVFWVLNRAVRGGDSDLSGRPTGASVAGQGTRPTVLAPATVASILHEGDESRIGASYEAARRWIADNHFRAAGPNREIYLGAVTEIQFPIEGERRFE